MHDRFHAIHAVSLKIFSLWNTGEHAFLWKSAHCRLPDFSNPGVCTKLFVWSEGREWSSVKSKNIIDGDDTTLRQIITKYSHFPFKSVCCFELLQANGFFLLFFCFSIHCRCRWDPLGFFFNSTSKILLIYLHHTAAPEEHLAFKSFLCSTCHHCHECSVRCVVCIFRILSPFDTAFISWFIILKVFWSSLYNSCAEKCSHISQFRENVGIKSQRIQTVCPPSFHRTIPTFNLSSLTRYFYAI